MERARFVTDRQTTDANGKNNVSPSGGDIMSYAGHKQFTIVSQCRPTENAVIYQKGVDLPSKKRGHYSIIINQT